MFFKFSSPMEEPISNSLSKLVGLSFFLGTINQMIPERLRDYIEDWIDRFIGRFHSYVRIKFNEYNNGQYNEAYEFIQSYLGTKSSKQSRYLKAEKSNDSKSVNISLDEGEEIIDVFEGIEFTWRAHEDKKIDRIQNNSNCNQMNFPLEKKYFVLSFHERFREIGTEVYLDYVVEEGKSIDLKNSKRKLFVNNHYDNWYWEGSKWNHINFEHPANFDTLAMDPKKKQEIIDDLISFKEGKDYYKSIGKAWKRGYLLYGPPGTGKSTMIAAIANFLEYDIYDLELTTVQDNVQLKHLLTDTRSKSIIVVEDIDCSVDFTSKRDKKKNNNSTESESEDEDEKKSKLTLSGLLNVIDGIWSACGPERIIIFTTNHVEKLDPALIRRGRMDLHIEMSYCKYEGFKVLAKNYLGIDSHPLFGEISSLLEVTKMSPCDVAEYLMIKNNFGDDAVETCLKKLIEACKKSKEEEEDNSGSDDNTEDNKNGVKSCVIKFMKKLTFFKKLKRRNN